MFKFVEELRKKFNLMHIDVLSIKSILMLRDELKLKEGCRVICRSNEDKPYTVGKIVRFESIGRTYPTLTPVVKCEKTEKEFLILGIIEKYSPELIHALDKLSPVDQWNVLSKNYKRKVK